MAYGNEAMISVEVKIPSFWYKNFDEETNTRDMIEERRQVARIQMDAKTYSEVLRL